jgi:hypothetical protein
MAYLKHNRALKVSVQGLDFIGHPYTYGIFVMCMQFVYVVKYYSIGDLYTIKLVLAVSPNMDFSNK